MPWRVPVTLRRHCWRGKDRAWIEVRGLDADGELGQSVLDALLAHSGVASAKLNYPLSRVVVEIDGAATSLSDLCRVVEGAERHCEQRHRTDVPTITWASLPGDGVVLATRAVTVAASAAGLGITLVGRATALPRLPITIAAGVTFSDYQPWLRRRLEDLLGGPATDTVMTLIQITSHTLSQSPTSLSIGLTLQSLKAAECHAEARAWGKHEPALARHADQPRASSSPRPQPSRGMERIPGRFALLQALSLGAMGVGTRNPNMAATAVQVTTPKANRTTAEAFAAALGRGLAEQHSVLPLRPESLRRLNNIDAIVIDPRVLCSDTLRVSRIRGVDESELPAAWNRAQLMLADTDLRPGWRAISGDRPEAEALFLPAHDPLASAVVGQAHRSGAELITVDDESLDELRPAFDDVRPLPNGTDRAIDVALVVAVTELRTAGRTVAVLSSSGAQAISSANLVLGIIPKQGAPPWNADLLLPDLTAAWRILSALPAANTAIQRGIAISAGAIAMGSLFLVPGVRGNFGSESANAGAAAGLLSGYLLARAVLNADTPRPAAVHEWHAMSIEQARSTLSASTTQQFPYPRRRLPAVVQLAETPARATWQLVKAVRAELSDPLTPVMALGSAASAVLGSPVDAVLVGSVLTGNSILAAAQRLRAEKRLGQLLAQQIPPARKVITDPDCGRAYTLVVAEQLRPGDVIEVRTHEVVPADARVIDEVDVEVDESTLTGESLSVEKQVEPTPGAPLAERRCMLYAGTTVVAGTAVALVTAVGPDTQQRRAADLISGELSSDIGLQHQLGRLTNQALPVSVTGGALVGALGLLRRIPLREAVSSGIAIAVAAVPEGMPLVATLAQASSARRLTKFGALVRVPRSVEALGRIDVVCFDKTGTLSENRLRVSQIHPAPGYSREEVLRCAAHAAPASDGPQIHATDAAIVEAAADVNGSGSRPPVAHLPFRSGRSFSASVTGTELTVKGAPEVVLAACGDVSAVEGKVAELAAGGLRVIAVAQRRLNSAQAQGIADNPEDIAKYCAGRLTLAGFLGLSDTPRPEAAGLLADLRLLGIGVKLITGDHPITAKAIAAELGLGVTAEQVITGAQWDALSRKDQERAVTERVIFARMTPENKVQVVQTLESAEVRTAMVGDGANDAAAIRAATVGIGVVAHGSDPAHLVADVVLVDGRIEALLEAIKEGHQLWRRVQAAVSVLLGGNAGEVMFAIIGSAITGTSPLNTRQLLLVNTMTDALPAAALAVSKPSGPIDPRLRGADQPALWQAVAIRGVTTAAATTVAWAMAGLTGPPLPRRASTTALVALVGTELGQTLLESQAPLVVLTTLGSLGLIGVLISTPGLSQLLGCTPLDPLGWAQGLGAATVATIATGLASRALPGPDKSAPEPPEASAERDEPGDQASEYRPPQRATAAHTVPVTAP